MTAKQTEQIFNKFYRANHGDTLPSGTGLGMTILFFIFSSISLCIMMIIQIKSVSHEKICPDFSVLLFTYSPLDNSQLSD